jgi:hypothetical protein
MKTSQLFYTLVSLFLFTIHGAAQIDIRKSQTVCDCIEQNFEQIGVEFESFLYDFEQELKEKSLIKDDRSSYQRLLDHSLNIYGFVPIHRNIDNKLVNANLVRITDFCVHLHLGTELSTQVKDLRHFVQKWKFINYLDYKVDDLSLDPFMEAFSEEGLDFKLNYWIYLEFLYLLMPPYNPYKTELGAIIDLEPLDGKFVSRNGEVIPWKILLKELPSFYDAGCYLKVEYSDYLNAGLNKAFETLIQESYTNHLEQKSMDDFGTGFWSANTTTRQSLINRYPFRLIE